MTTHRLRLQRVFDAAPQRVFDAFVRADAIRSWFGPAGFAVSAASVDSRPGGRYRYEMRAPDGSLHVVAGEFREVLPPHRLSFTWSWLEGGSPGAQTLVTIDFADREGRTELTLVHEGFATEAARDGHDKGWGSSFDCLAEMLAGRPKPALPSHGD